MPTSVCRLSFLLLFLFLFTACRKELSTASGPQLQLQFTNKVDGQNLQLGGAYQNHFGEAFTVSRFKYYISNLALRRNGNFVPLADTYFLVDEGVDSSKTLRTALPAGTFDGIAFLIGVDSTRNVSGAQTGALDPALDMFWTWNTGYIMAKLEGQSPLSTAPNNRIQYHIGGFAGAYSALRTVVLSFPEAVTLSGVTTLKVDVEAELQKWFDGVHELKIGDEAVSMTPGELSSRFADNYASMFTLTAAAAQ